MEGSYSLAGQGRKKQEIIVFTKVTSLMLTRKFQFGCLKVKFLGKIETVISYVLSLGLLMWEPNKDDSIRGLLCITPSKA